VEDAEGTSPVIDEPAAPEVEISAAPEIDAEELARLESGLADVQSVLDQLSRIPQTSSADDDPAPIIRGLVDDGRFEV
jgi:hypothetical protein